LGVHSLHSNRFSSCSFILILLSFKDVCAQFLPSFLSPRRETLELLVGKLGENPVGDAGDEGVAAAGSATPVSAAGPGQINRTIQQVGFSLVFPPVGLFFGKNQALLASTAIQTSIRHLCRMLSNGFISFFILFCHSVVVDVMDGIVSGGWVARQIAQRYHLECRSTFEELSKIAQRVAACRRQIVAYDVSQRSRAGQRNGPSTKQTYVHPVSPRCHLVRSRVVVSGSEFSSWSSHRTEYSFIFKFLPRYMDLPSVFTEFYRVLPSFTKFFLKLVRFC